MQIAPLEDLVRNAELPRPRAHVRVRRLDRLLHHVAEMTGDHGLSCSLHPRRLDEQNLASCRRPCKTRGNSDLGRALSELVGVQRHAEKLAHFRARDADRRLVTARGRARRLSGDACDLARQLPHARFRGVLANDGEHRVVLEGDTIR